MQIHSEEVLSQSETRKQPVTLEGVKLMQRNACRHLWLYSSQLTDNQLSGIFFLLFLVRKGGGRGRGGKGQTMHCHLLLSFICYEQMVLLRPAITVSFSIVTSLPDIRQTGRSPKMLLNSTRYLWLFRLFLNAKVYMWAHSADLFLPSAHSEILLWFKQNLFLLERAAMSFNC